MIKKPSMRNLGKENETRSAEQLVDPINQALLDNLTAAGFLTNPAPPTVCQTSPLQLPAITAKLGGSKIPTKRYSPDLLPNDWGHWADIETVDPKKVTPVIVKTATFKPKATPYRGPVCFLPTILESTSAKNSSNETKSENNKAVLLISS